MYEYFMVAFTHSRGSEIFKVWLPASQQDRLHQKFIDRFKRDYDDINIVAVKKERFVHGDCL